MRLPTPYRLVSETWETRDEFRGKERITGDLPVGGTHAKYHWVFRTEPDHPSCKPAARHGMSRAETASRRDN